MATTAQSSTATTDLNPWYQLKAYARHLREAGIGLPVLAIPVGFSVLASLAEGVSLILLVPFIQGIIQGDFRFAADLPLIGSFVQSYPVFFLSGSKNITILLLLLTLASVTFKVVFSFFSRITGFRIVRRFANSLRKQVYRRYLSFGKFYFDQQNKGYLQQVLLEYVFRVSTCFGNLQLALQSFFMLAVYVGVMLSINWKLTLVVVAVFPLLHRMLTSLIKRIKTISHELTDRSNQFALKISNALTVIPLVKAYCAEEFEHERFSEISDQVEATQNELDSASHLISPLQEIINLILLFVLVGIIGIFIKTEGDWNVAGYTVFILVLRRASHALGVFNAVRGVLAEVSGLFSEIEKVFDDSDKFFVEEGITELSGFHTGIEIIDLSYTYPGGKQALNGLTLSLKKGEMTAIVGETGSGKSTLMNLLMRFYELPAGAINIDGRPLEEITLKSWRSMIALVGQEAHLFNSTLEENLLYGLKHEVSEEKMRAVLAQSRLEKLITELPRGLKTLIGDRGVQLSGGERQRVSIARALLKQADILFLDEATSALDSKTEREIQLALDDLVKGKTTLVIAHRLSTIQHADKVVVLEDGKVVEQGAPEELLAQKGSFFRYCEYQRLP